MRDRLLIVDDEVAVRKQIRWGLAECFDIEESDGGDEAMAQYRRLHPDVVSLDIRLTGPRCQRGLELLERMLGEDPLVKVVMVTADDDLGSATRAMEVGAWDYYAKPIEIEDLKLILQRASHVRRLQAARSKSAAAGPLPEHLEEWLGESPQARRIARLLRSLAGGNEPVLIQGEPGTGRDLAARALHDLGPHRGGPFVRITGGEGLPAPDALGAAGTLFIDDVRALPEAELDRLPAWVEDLGDRGRVIVSAPPDLASIAAAGDFSEVTYHFLAALTVLLPPLRERPEDIETIAGSLVATYATRFGRPARALAPGARDALRQYHWPGNFRELEKRVLGAVLVCESDTLSEDDLWPRPVADDTGGLRERLSDLEKSLVEQALRDNHGNVSRSARSLDVSRPTMHALLRKHGIDPDRYRQS